MGLSSSVLNLVLSLYKDQYFEKFNSVIELGSQHLSANGDDVAFVINNFGFGIIFKIKTLFFHSKLSSRYDGHTQKKFNNLYHAPLADSF